jgi:quercetin dioxygenase-like cupin family protein
MSPRIEVLVRSEQSHGDLAIMENVVRAGFAGPPLHHHAFDETFYVLDGELTFQLEDRVFARGAGQHAFAPRGVPHTYANLSGEDARMLLICTPGGFERYFDMLLARERGAEPPPDTVKDWPEVTVVGPRIGG